MYIRYNLFILLLLGLYDAVRCTSCVNEERIAVLEYKLKQQQDKISELEQNQMGTDEIVRTQNEIIKLISRKIATNDNSTVREDKELTSVLFGRLEERNTRNTKAINRGIRQKERTAFTVYATKPIEHLGVGQPIKFDKILTNVGDDFNIHTGIFTVPVDGLYAFSFYIAEYQVHEFIASLAVDGNRLVQGIADALSGGQDIQGGNFAILSLSAGQTVWLESDVSDGYIWAAPTQRFESFSGFLLY